MRIAVVMPSRGLVSSRGVEAVLREVGGCSSELFLTHDLPLPLCFNQPVERVLEQDFTHVWFVEEDVVVPPRALDILLGVNTDIAAIDYPLRYTKLDGMVPLSSYRFLGQLLWVSLGCTLVRRVVFERVERPWFVTDWDVVAIHKGSKEGWSLDFIKQRDPEKYGGQDSAFCYRALKAGCTLGRTDEAFAEHLPVIGPKKEAA